VGCTGTGAITEFDFIKSTRDRSPEECRGPLVALSLTGHRLDTLEQSFHSQRAHELLWNAYDPDPLTDRVTFKLCAAHWMDLSYLAGMRARLIGRREWMSEASALLKEVCQGARFDPKEIANMIAWQRG
jgi:hypothetical protein